jgi:hypothetical protein
MLEEVAMELAVEAIQQCPRVLVYVPSVVVRSATLALAHTRRREKMTMTWYVDVIFLLQCQCDIFIVASDIMFFI